MHKSGFKKFICEHRVYLWLIILSLVMVIFSSLNPYPSEIKKVWEEKITQWENFSIEEFIRKLENNLHLYYILKITFFLGFILFIFGIYFSFSFLVSLWRGGISLFSQNFPDVSWQVSDILRVLIIIFFFVNILKVGEPIFWGIFEFNPTHLFWQFILRAFLIDLFSLGVIIYFVVKKYFSSLAQLGLRFKNFINNLLFAFYHYLGIIPLLFLAVFLSFSFTVFLKYKPEPSPLLFFFFQPQPKILVFLSFLFIAIFGPIVEEIFFRGFCYPPLRNRLNPLKAMFLVSFFFAWLHMNIIGFLPIFVLGLLLVYVYEKSQSLIPSIFIHMLHNSLILYSLFLYRVFWWK